MYFINPKREISEINVRAQFCMDNDIAMYCMLLLNLSLELVTVVLSCYFTCLLCCLCS